jgi:hypothetical protein
MELGEQGFELSTEYNCKVGELRRRFDAALNGADAMLEAEAATSELVDPDKYYEDRTFRSGKDVVIVQEEHACTTCGGTAVMDTYGVTSPETCKTSGSCELEVLTTKSEAYGDGPVIVPCRPFGVACEAVVSLGDDRTPTIISGECRIAMTGFGWVAKASGTLARIDESDKPVDPEDGIPPYDGEQFYA